MVYCDTGVDKSIPREIVPYLVDKVKGICYNEAK